ncbi:hypothetical protein [Halochromatium roseum]|uniref:hypothetical protein n=1 Tax=Halochromatium roseum TaxID=391920 RepID=UPI001A91C131|nr:hypothetical protein [Halochromatium roseum]MBK5941846.1 hypothetical protein [Halochromatium roseum]
MPPTIITTRLSSRTAVDSSRSTAGAGSNTKARELLGWVPQYGGLDGFRRGLSVTVAWFTEPSRLAQDKVDRYNL